MKKYLTDWGKNYHKDGQELLKITALEPVWDMAHGWHPDIDVDNSFYDPEIRQPLKPKPVPKMPPLISMRPEGVSCGHVLMRDSGTASLIQPDGDAPILPLFVRDLSGKVVYLGITRHKNTHQAGVSKHAMPQGAMVFEETSEGYNLLERVFFCCFRFVEVSDKPRGHFAGTEVKKAIVSYFAPNLYPYKLRLDTFYQDGWRLPQTEMLYVQRVAERVTADRAAQDIGEAWQSFGSENYAEFLEAEEGLIAKAFKSGCTLIPTFEAFNGLNKVDDDFNHTGFWPGRAVVGLHEVVQKQSSDAPAGTILKVLEPGYMTNWEIKPARVIVSDGIEYAASERARYRAERPTALYPDLRLPHQRTSCKWGAVWLPQHPADFEEPAIWGWEADASGRFVQMRGPLWDPLHYYYECVPKVQKSFEKLRLKKNMNLVKIPDEMLERFYPVSGVEGFDTFHIEKKKEKIYNGFLLPTAIVHQKDSSCLTNIGYHPLPAHFEFELDNWWFPDLAPKHRVSDIIPLNIEKKLAKVIHPTIPPDKFIESVRGAELAPWANDPLVMTMPQTDPLYNYPYLKRYLKPAVSESEMYEITFLYLEEQDEEGGDSKASFAAPMIRQMEEVWPGLYHLYINMSQKANQIMTQRRKVYVEDLGAYVVAYWSMAHPDTIFREDATVKDPKKNLPTSAVSGSAEF